MRVMATFLVGQEEGDLLAIDPREVDQLDEIDAPLPRLALRHVGLRLP